LLKGGGRVTADLTTRAIAVCFISLTNNARDISDKDRPQLHLPGPLLSFCVPGGSITQAGSATEKISLDMDETFYLFPDRWIALEPNP
jgi:hypothetical protein